jgi:acetoin utilization protein AcuC
MSDSRVVSVHMGEAVGNYGFGQEHPFGRDRLDAFMDEMLRQHIDYLVRYHDPVMATESELLLFHDANYLERIRRHSESGEGILDYGDTPAFKGVFEVASYVVGTTLDAVRKVMQGDVRRAFVPIGGLHHAMPDAAAGFCVFNDIGVAIRALQQDFGLQRIAYVDIDAHHGDGVFYPFESDPEVIFADIHEDGRYNFPRTGFPEETGKGRAEGRKLNIPLLPRASDKEFLEAWAQVENFLGRWEPEIILLQCGADGLTGDPLAHLCYSHRVHGRVGRGLCELAERFARGRLLAMGGGGYELRNVGKAWSGVVRSLLDTPMPT